MGLKLHLLKLRENKIRKTCKDIYNRAKKMRPEKSERDLLKLVLITKPPFDYQHDKIIDEFLEICKNIDELSKLISKESKTNSSLWEFRDRNLKHSNLKDRNRIFFNEFWKK